MSRARQGVSGEDVNLEPSGVWYCRKHCGTVNEDEGHGIEDVCPWSDTRYLGDGTPVDPCDWTELLYRKANV